MSATSKFKNAFRFLNLKPIDAFLHSARFEYRFDSRPTADFLRKEWFLGLVSFISILALMVFYQDNPEFSVKLTIFQFMLLAVLVATIGKHFSFLQTATIGQGKPVLFSLAVGVALGLALTVQSFGILVPSALIAAPLIIQTIIIVGFVAPIVEEWFFRGFLFPTFSELFASPAMGIILSSSAFSFFHWFVYGTNPAALLTTFVFAVGMCLLVGFTRSTAGVFVAHMIVNTKAIGLW